MPNNVWNPLSHSSIQKLEANLWIVQGSLPNMSLQRVMTIVRMNDGRLLFHSAIALNESEMQAIEEWGQPAYLIVPNGYHRLDAPAYKERYPQLQVFCPRGARKKVGAVVSVDGTYEEFPNNEIVRLEMLAGVVDSEGFMSVSSGESISLVLNDVIFNMPHLSGSVGFVLKHITKSSGGPKITNIAKWLLIKNKQALRAHLEQLSETPTLKRIIVSHHVPIEQAVAGTLRQIAATL